MAKDLIDYVLTGAPSYTFSRPREGDTVTLHQGETTAAVGLNVTVLDAEKRKLFTRIKPDTSAPEATKA